MNPCSRVSENIRNFFRDKISSEALFKKKALEGPSLNCKPVFPTSRGDETRLLLYYKSVLSLILKTCLFCCAGSRLNQGSRDFNYCKQHRGGPFAAALIFLLVNGRRLSVVAGSLFHFSFGFQVLRKIVWLCQSSLKDDHAFHCLCRDLCEFQF